MELDDGHGDEGDQKMIFLYSNLEKKKKQNRLKAKVYLLDLFCFTKQDTIEGVFGFRIDNCTIKRESLIALVI
jgi:hypothetical protein